VVIAADAQAEDHFRRFRKLGSRLAGVVEVNPEALGRNALHLAAHGVLQPRFEALRLRAAEQVAARLGSDDPRVAIEIPAIQEAALGGRISMLLLSADAALPADGSGQEDPLDASAAGTLRTAGMCGCCRKRICLAALPRLRSSATDTSLGS